MSHLRRSGALATTLVLLALGAGASAAQAAAPQYYPSGPQTQVARSAVSPASGWTQCFAGSYTESPSLPGILEACDGEFLMLAGAPDEDAPFIVLAAAPRADVLHRTAGPEDMTDTHRANGSEWYYTPAWSWGFARAGDDVNLFSCDTNGFGSPDGDFRLCWHSFTEETLNYGFRAGNQFYNDDSTARRYIFESGPVTTKRCAAELAAYRSALEVRAAARDEYVSKRAVSRAAATAYYGNRPRGSRAALDAAREDTAKARAAFVEAKGATKDAQLARLACLAPR